MRRLLAVALVGLGAAGCLNFGADPAPTFGHVHAIGPVTVQAPQGPRPHTLGVHLFRARKRFDERIQREEEDGRIAVLELERWAENPDAAATDAVREALAASGLFAGVFPSSEGARATRALHGFVLGFHMVQRSGGPALAVFRVRLDLVDVKTGALLRSAVHEGTSPLPGASVQGIGAAMGKAVSAVLSAAIADWLAAGVL